MTDTTGALATALAKVQADLPKLERDRTVEIEKKSGGTYSYSYVTLANLNDAILPLLAKHGLAFAALPGTGADGKMSLRYHLLHDSGEQLSGEFPISGEGGIQMVGGRITYSRRYVLAALVGVAADEDDESQLGGDAGPSTARRATPPRKQAPAATQGRTAQRQKAAAPPPLPNETDDKMSDAERGKMMALFTELGITDRAERLQKSSEIVDRKLASANDMDPDERRHLIDTLELMKSAQDADPNVPEDNFGGRDG
jgi:hypothetical protein